MADIFKRDSFKIILLVSIFIFNSFFGFCEEDKKDSVISLNLEDAVKIAFGNNKVIQIQEQEISVARAGILGSISNFLPKLNVNAAYEHNEAVAPAVSAGKKDAGIFTGYRNDNMLGASIDETIFNGGADFANLRKSNLTLKVQIETLRAKKLDVEFEAKRLYYGLLLAYETERITQDLVGQAQSHYLNVKKKFEQGTASKFDVLQSKVQVTKLIPELVKAKNSIEIIKSDLKKLLYLKMQDDIAVRDTLGYTLINIDEGDFLKEAYLNNPEMILRALGIDIAKWSIWVARAGILPQIAGRADYDYRSNSYKNMFNEQHSNWNAGVTVTIPIFDGFSTKAKVDGAKAKYEQANLEKEDVIEAIAVDIRRACLDLKEAQAVIDSQKDNIVEAKEALRIANIGYDNGVTINLDVLDTQVSLSQVEKNLSEGIYDYLMAKAYLDRTMGKALVIQTQIDATKKAKAKK